MGKKKKEEIEIKEPCASCSNRDSFSFEGCAKQCRELFERAKKVLGKGNPSPCTDWRCGLPIAKEDPSVCWPKCRWVNIHVSLQKEKAGIRSALRKEPVRTRATREEWMKWRAEKYLSLLEINPMSFRKEI